MNASLLAPAGLFAAISLGIVLLLHIRRQTPPPRIFPSLRFWTASESTETDRQRLRRPPLTLSLLLQLLLAAVVTLALARPAVSDAFGGLGGRTTPQHQITLLDGSSSMLARNPDEQRNRFEAARQEALSLLDDWQAGDVATVLALGTTMQTRSASNRQQVGELRDWLRQLHLPGGQADLNAALRLAGNLGLADRDNRIVLVTDTALSVDPEIVATVPMPIDVIDVSGGVNAGNIAVTAIDARPIAGTNNQFAVTFSIDNFTGEEADVPWFVEADDAEIASNTAFLTAGGSQQVTVNLPVGAVSASATLDIQDGLFADNSALLSLDPERLGQLDILMISDAPSNLLRALQVIPGTKVDVQPSSLPGIRDLAYSYDLVVYEGAAPLTGDVPETPMLIVQPPAGTEGFQVTGTANAPTLTNVDAGDPLLEGVDLSGVTWGTTPVYATSESARLLATGSDGTVPVPLIWVDQLDGNDYVAFGFSIAESNISQRVAFPILVASVVRTLTTSPIPMSVPVGDPIEIAPSAGVTGVEVTLPNQTVRTVEVDEQASGTGVARVPAVIDFTGIPGQYRVRELRGDGSVEREGVFVVNAGHAQESNLTPISGLASTLEKSGSTTSEAGTVASGMTELWWALSLFALLVMVIEWFVADRSRGTRPTPAMGAQS